MQTENEILQKFCTFFVLFYFSHITIFFSPRYSLTFYEYLPIYFVHYIHECINTHLCKICRGKSELCMQIKTSHRYLRGCLKFINGTSMLIYIIYSWDMCVLGKYEFNEFDLKSFYFVMVL